MGKSEVGGQLSSPPWIANGISSFLKRAGVNQVWECACGNGNLVRGLKAHGFNVIGTDILFGQDFFIYEPPVKYDVIVTCPQFSVKDKFIKRAYELKKPFAYLLPFETLSRKALLPLFQRYPPEIIVFDQMVDWRNPNTDKAGSFTVWSVWITYGLHIGKQITFLHMDNGVVA